ncbi:hypothetical protein KJ840_05660 [Patescibacteria group bacterium]|nr:hypothetical protein [Patescibacteria group bacterium]
MATTYLVLIAKKASTAGQTANIETDTRILLVDITVGNLTKFYSGKIIDSTSGIEPEATITFDLPEGLQLPPLFTANFDPVPPEIQGQIKEMINQLRKK